MSSRKWLGICLAVTVIAALVMVAVVYVVDPLNYIRWNDGPRFFNSGVSFIPGIVRNYGANTYLIGSSMIQNTDMQYMRDSGVGLPVVKLEKSGMTVNETLMVLRLIQSQVQSPDALINIDFVTFFTDDKIGPASDNLKGYLYNHSSLDDWKYFFDYKAISEPIAPGTASRLMRGVKGSNKYGEPIPGQAKQQTINLCREHGAITDEMINPLRNKRDVWIINTVPFKGGHYAAYPPKLVETCLLAGCPEGGVVLDPFMGSGTTGMVAKQLDRHYIGIELNPEYKELAEARIGGEI